jgi:LysR family transcriptional regulator, regulator for genes of the gallate degradation pathway
MTASMSTSLRHLRLIGAIAQTRSITKAAVQARVSQPAVSLALAKFDAVMGAPMFARSAKGLHPTAAGAAVCLRIGRALAHLDPALAALSPRLHLTCTMAQLRALIAVTEAESFSAAARALGVAQPTVHRAIAQIERDCPQPLFDRTAHGVLPRPPARALVMAAQLAFAEMEQARADVGEALGLEVGRIVLGAMPLSRAVLLGPAIAAFRAARPNLPIRVVDGPYADLALGLRRGEIDMLIGALRVGAGADDTEQIPLLTDHMAIVARHGHAAHTQGWTLAQMARAPWVVAPHGTPARSFFDDMFTRAGHAQPQSLIETGSMTLMQDLALRSDHLAFVSRHQVAGALASRQLVLLAHQPTGTARDIGLTLRKGWVPTAAQRDMLGAIKDAAAALG